MPQNEPLARLFRRMLAQVYFRSIRVNGRDLIPDAGVVLFASIHRNGAVDGLITEVVLDAPLNIVGRNLTASPYLRFLLAGSIAVYHSPATAAESRKNLRYLQEAARIEMRVYLRYSLNYRAEKDE